MIRDYGRRYKYSSADFGAYVPVEEELNFAQRRQIMEQLKSDDGYFTPEGIKRLKQELATNKRIIWDLAGGTRPLSYSGYTMSLALDECNCNNLFDGNHIPHEKIPALIEAIDTAIARLTREQHMKGKEWVAEPEYEDGIYTEGKNVGYIKSILEEMREKSVRALEIPEAVISVIY